MKTMKLSEMLTVFNAKRVAALLMAILMLVLAGCTTGGSEKPDDTSSNQSNVTSEPDSDVTPDDGSTESSQKVDPYKGVINTDAQVETNNERTDANEVTPVVDGSNLAYGYKGYAQKERDKLQKEILNTPNTENFYKLKGKIYYVSTSGNDSNDGLSPETAVQSLSAVDALQVQPGDAVLFQRGCLWRMLERFECREGVIYGSYGTGRKPMFYGSPKNYAQEIWKPSKKKNVWQMSYMYAQPANAIFNQGEAMGYQKLTIRELEKNTDFFLDTETATLYLYCDKGNPTNVWTSIEMAQEPMLFHLSTGVDNVVIDNLAIRYMGTGGVGSTYNSNGWSVTNCEIGFTGGVWMGNVRGGNGIGTWVGGENLTWDHNWVYQTFDSAMSPQGNMGKKYYDYHDISMSHNLFEFNNADIETWESGKAENGGPSDYYNYFMDYNICRFTSLGWGTRVNDGGIRGIDGVHYGHLSAGQIKPEKGKFSFSNNIIDCPGRMIYKFTIYDKPCYDAWTRENNVYYIKQSMRTTTALTFQFHWIDEETRVSGHAATTKDTTLKAFAEFEPDAKVYWYK